MLHRQGASLHMCLTQTNHYHFLRTLSTLNFVLILGHFFENVFFIGFYPTLAAPTTTTTTTTTTTCLSSQDCPGGSRCQNGQCACEDGLDGVWGLGLVGGCITTTTITTTTGSFEFLKMGMSL